MTWQLLRTVTPTYDWQVIEVPIVGASAIRIEQSWQPEGDFPGVARIILGQQFADGSLVNFKRVFPYRSPRLVLFEIPDYLQTAGWLVYFLAVKLNLYARYSAEADWQIDFYQLSSGNVPALTPDPGTGENEPDLPDITYDGGRETV